MAFPKGCFGMACAYQIFFTDSLAGTFGTFELHLKTNSAPKGKCIRCYNDSTKPEVAQSQLETSGLVKALQSI